MATDIVIRAEGLGKKYVIGHQAEREANPTFRDTISRSFRSWGRSARDMLRGQAIVAGDDTEEFWALKDINFEIRRGEVVGIIGRNGAGKSTLLKILSRITEPTEGRVTIDGRIASLLEVGTGFHPELTGRENIYLNGAILGMTRIEIKQKFDEIVHFAGVERFLDTPVKRFSSGMYVRLAFAVSAHLEPDILIVDEVLAVGDADFQKKCLGKMKDVASNGRTVLFVSHNMTAIQVLCSRGLLLQTGQIVEDGTVASTFAKYSNSRSHHTRSRRASHEDKDVTITAVTVEVCDAEILFEIEVEANRSVLTAVEIGFFDGNNAPIAFAESGCWNEANQLRLSIGTTVFTATIDAASLATGTYVASVALSKPGVAYYDKWTDVVTFDLTKTPLPHDTGTLHQSQGHGSILLDCALSRRLSSASGEGPNY